MRDALAVDEMLCQACGECVRECTRHQTVVASKHVDHTDPL